MCLLFCARPSLTRSLTSSEAGSREFDHSFPSLRPDSRRYGNSSSKFEDSGADDDHDADDCGSGNGAAATAATDARRRQAPCAQCNTFITERSANGTADLCHGGSSSSSGQWTWNAAKIKREALVTFQRTLSRRLAVSRCALPRFLLWNGLEWKSCSARTHRFPFRSIDWNERREERFRFQGCSQSVSFLVLSLSSRSCLTV